MIWLLACVEPPPPTLTATWAGDGAELHASAPILAVRVVDAEGATVLRRTLPTPATEVFLPLEAVSGAFQVEASTDAGDAGSPLSIPAQTPWVAEIQPAPGAAWVPATGKVEVPVWGESASVFVRFTAGPQAIDVPTDLGIAHLAAPGSRVLLPLTLTSTQTLALGPDVVDLIVVRRNTDEARTALQVAPLIFPADESGLRDIGRPVGKVILPSPAWERLLAASGWGVRARANEAPWGFVGVPLQNEAAEPMDLVVTVKVTDRDGAAAEAFRPRLREADGGTQTVAALVRVPAHGRATAVLPVFVEPVTVAAGSYDLQASLTPLGAADTLASATLPLVVRRGDAVSSAGFFITLLASTAGILWAARTLPSWLRRASITDLMVNALFATALFVVSTATDVVSMTLGAALGPFSTLFTGIVYDAGRCVLLATLLHMQPRPGTLALSILCSWLGRGVLMGTLGFPDLVHTGAAIALGESFAYASGITRGQPMTILRLMCAFALSNALLTLSGLWLHTVLYRLTFAPWYIAMQVALPGFLYVLLACTLAVPFARSLREVDG